MGSVLCLPFKLLGKLCNGSPNFAVVCCCFPLALFILLASSLLAGWGGWTLYSGLQRPEWPDYASITTVVLGSIQALAGVCGVLATVFRWPQGLALFKTGYKLAVAVIVIYLVQEIARWIQKGIRKEAFTNQELADMVVLIVLCLVYIGATFWILSGVVSLQRVLTVGGHGWECLNYKDIVKRKELREGKRKAREAQQKAREAGKGSPQAVQSPESGANAFNP